MKRLLREHLRAGEGTVPVFFRAPPVARGECVHPTPFDDAAIVTVDALERATTTIGHGQCADQDPAELRFPVLGQLRFRYYTTPDSSTAASIVDGPRALRKRERRADSREFVAKIGNVVDIREDIPSSRTWTTSTTPPARMVNEPRGSTCLCVLSNLESEMPRSMNMAVAIQQVTEETSSSLVVRRAP